ncbi:MAG TPA: HAMP domain-containing sensor histidine kinase [Candidatus Dormibacteraeota bacterium]
MSIQSKPSPRRAGRLASRRLRALAGLLLAASQAGEAGRVCGTAAELLALDPELFPFVLIYLLEGGEARLVASAAIDGAGPELLEASNWPLAAAVENGAPVLAHRMAALPGSAVAAFAVPIAGRQEQQTAAGVLVAGVAERFVTDRDHATFLQLVAGQLASSLAGVGWAAESAELRAQVARSMELERHKAEFLRLASHELRGPLAVIRGYLDMVADETFGELSPSVQQVLPIVIAKIDEMNRLVEQMLDTARLDENKLTLNRQRVDLRELARECANAFAPLAEGTHRFQFQLPAEPVLVEVDRNRLAGVITNVIDNAIKYSPEGGAITVACTADPATGTARLEVGDQGLGISETDLPRLFTRFGRIVTAENSHISGTGLGLYLARQISRMHGGDIALESTPGRGTCVDIRLPLAPVAAAVEEHAPIS